jgi:FkbM family methyltransferase
VAGEDLVTQTHAAAGSDQTLANRLRERAKLVVRGMLRRIDLDVSRGPYATRLVRTMDAHGFDTLLDVGANVGQFGALARDAGFAGRIISCEPLTGAFAQLRGRADRDGHWTALHTAVGSEPGTTTINVSANSFSSSVLTMTEEHLRSAPGSGYIASESVPLTTVAELVTQHGIDPSKTLLKIDTQGYEAEVLAGAGDLIGEFGAVQLELSFVELYAGQQLFDELYERMRKSGYHLHIVEPGYSDKTGRLMQCDGLFVRDDLSA